MLRHLEKLIQPRCPTLIKAAKRAVAVGGVVLLLDLCLLVPLLLSNFPPALLIFLIALAFPQEDGVPLCASLLGTLLVIATVVAPIWHTMRATGLS